MNKYLILIVILILTATNISVVRAQEVNEVNIDIWAILDTALNWFFGITLAVAVIMLIYAGFT